MGQPRKAAGPVAAPAEGAATPAEQNEKVLTVEADSVTEIGTVQGVAEGAETPGGDDALDVDPDELLAAELQRDAALNALANGPAPVEVVAQVVVAEEPRANGKHVDWTDGSTEGTAEAIVTGSVVSGKDSKGGQLLAWQGDTITAPENVVAKLVRLGAAYRMD